DFDWNDASIAPASAGLKCGCGREALSVVRPRFVGAVTSAIEQRGHDLGGMGADDFARGIAKDSLAGGVEALDVALLVDGDEAIDGVVDNSAKAPLAGIEPCAALAHRLHVMLKHMQDLNQLGDFITLVRVRKAKRDAFAARCAP